MDVSTTILPGPSAASAASSTSTTSGELGTQRTVTSLAATTAAGPSPSTRAERDRGVDRAAAARRDGDVVAGLDEVARHRQTHGPEPDETDLHRTPQSAR